MEHKIHSIIDKKKKKLHVICVRNMIALEFDDIVLEIYVPISKYHKVI